MTTKQSVEKVIENKLSSIFERKVKCKSVITTVGEYIETYQPGLLLDLNPITQRPPIYLVPDNKKSVDIVKDIMEGGSLNMITIVKCNKGSQFIWESLDGGHRKRALHDYYNNEFKVNGKLFQDLSDEDQEYFLNIEMKLDIYEPMSNYLKGERFRILNGTMNPPNHQELLNSFGDVAIANAIRETVREEFDENHKLFELTNTKNSKWVDVQNSRLKLEEFVARIYYRYYQDGFLGSRKDAQLHTMYADENVKVKSIKKKVDEHLNFLFKMVKIRKNKSTKMGWRELNTLSNVYHYFNENLGNWTLFNDVVFYEKFSYVFYDYQLDKNKKYGDVVDFEFEKDDVTVKECFKNYTTCHDSYAKQEQLVKWVVEHDDFKLNLSVRVLDTQRLFSKEVKTGSLALQGYKCGIDGQDLKYEDAEAAHDVAFILGGSSKDSSNCVMVRKEYNQKMGTLTIAQYKKKKGFA